MYRNKAGAARNLLTRTDARFLNILASGMLLNRLALIMVTVIGVIIAESALEAMNAHAGK